MYRAGEQSRAEGHTHSASVALPPAPAEGEATRDVPAAPLLAVPGLSVW